MKPAAAQSPRGAAAALRNGHLVGAAFLAPFLLLHIGNHLLAPASIQAHLEAMTALRIFYRHPVVEAIVLFFAASQALTGLDRVLVGWRARKGMVARLQAGSGTVLAVFVVIHVVAVLVGRHLLELDTNFHFAAAGMHVPPLGVLFAPYYALAVAALFAHLGCAAWWRLAPTRPRLASIVLAIASAGGLTAGVLIVAAMAGAFEPYRPPSDYTAPYRLLGVSG